MVARNEPCAVAILVLEVDEPDRRQTVKGQFLGQQECPSSTHEQVQPLSTLVVGLEWVMLEPIPNLKVCLSHNWENKGFSHSVSVTLLFA